MLEKEEKVADDEIHRWRCKDEKTKKKKNNNQQQDISAR